MEASLRLSRGWRQRRGDAVGDSESDWSGTVARKRRSAQTRTLAEGRSNRSAPPPIRIRTERVNVPRQCRSPFSNPGARQENLSAFQSRGLTVGYFRCICVRAGGKLSPRCPLGWTKILRPLDPARARNAAILVGAGSSGSGHSQPPSIVMVSSFGKHFFERVSNILKIRTTSTALMALAAGPVIADCNSEPYRYVRPRTVIRGSPGHPRRGAQIRIPGIGASCKSLKNTEVFGPWLLTGGARLRRTARMVGDPGSSPGTADDANRPQTSLMLRTDPNQQRLRDLARLSGAAGLRGL